MSGTGLGIAAFHYCQVVKIVIGCVPFFLLSGGKYWSGAAIKNLSFTRFDSRRRTLSTSDKSRHYLVDLWKLKKFSIDLFLIFFFFSGEKGLPGMNGKQGRPGQSGN